MFCRFKDISYLCSVEKAKRYTEREIKTTFVLIVFYRLTF